MSSTFSCSCGKVLIVRPEQWGIRGRCPHCKNVLDIPGPQTASNPGKPPQAEEVTESVTAQRPPGRQPAADIAVQSAAPTAGFGPELPPEGDYLESMEAPPYKLFSPGSAVLATFLSNLLGGGLVLARNYWVLGRKRAALATLTTAILLTLAHLIYIIWLPDNSRLWIVAILLTLVAMLVLARVLQGQVYADHVRQGGRTASAWLAAGLGLLAGGLSMGFIFAWFAMVGDSYPSLQFGQGEEVYYAPPVTEAEARQLGQALQAAGYFDNTGPAGALLAREGKTWIVSIAVAEGAWDNPESVAYFRDLQKRLAPRLFPGQRKEIRLCDDSWTPRKTMRE